MQNSSPYELISRIRELIAELPSTLVKKDLSDTLHKLEQVSSRTFEKLQESNIRLLELIQSLSSGILVEDENRKIVLVNKEFCNIFNIPVNPDDLRGFDCSSSAEQSKHLFMDPEGFIKSIEEILQNRLLVRNEELFFADGRAFERDYIPVYLNGSYKGHLWNYRDITERKKSELSLRDGNIYIKSLLQAIPDLIFVLDSDGIFIDYRSGSNDNLLFPEDTFIGKSISDVLPEPLSNTIKSGIKEVLNNLPINPIEYSLPVQKGLGYFECKLLPLNSNRILGLVRDITQVKQNEFTLHRNIKQQELLSEIALELNSLEEYETKIGLVLEKVGRFTGVSRVYIFEDDVNHELTSNTFEWCNNDIISQKSELQNIPYEMIPSWKMQLAGNGRIYSEDITELPADLRAILEPQDIKSIVVYPLSMKEEFFGFIGFDECVRNKKWTKNELELLKTISGILSSAFERRKAEAELSKLVKDLELSNKSLSDFAYIASHDLREPLRKISSFGSLLSKTISGKLDEDEKENLQFMIDGARRMQQMIDDLLFYSRITLKSSSYIDVNIDLLIKDILQYDLAALIEENGAGIIIETELGSYKGEKTQLKQLLQNLIANAVKYRRKDVAPVVKIRSIHSEDKYIIRVEDNGIGINGKYKEQIFEMFKRLHSKNEYSGSGIGLAVCKKIVELYGGAISVRSVPGEGSVFEFELPLRSQL